MTRGNAAGGQLDLVLLSALGSLGEAHGYALIAAVRDRTDGALDVPEGSVYPALQRLERAGMLDGRWDTGGGRRRRLYRLSADGRAALADRQAEWRGFAASMERLMRWAPA